MYYCVVSSNTICSGRFNSVMLLISSLVGNWGHHFFFCRFSSQRLRIAALGWYQGAYKSGGCFVTNSRHSAIPYAYSLNCPKLILMQRIRFLCLGSTMTNLARDVYIKLYILLYINMITTSRTTQYHTGVPVQ